MIRPLEEIKVKKKKKTRALVRLNCLPVYLLLLLLLFTAIGFSPVGSSPYTSTHNTNGHIIYIKVTIQNKLYTITKQNTYSKHNKYVIY
jgi:hypothetical protein